MSANSSIEWTDRTWNPVRGCSIVSPGCVNCYAMKQAHRFSGKGRAYEGLTKLTSAGPQWTGKVRPVEDALLEPLKWKKPQRVFVNSMSDLFHEGVPFEFIDKVFAVMALAPQHTFQILTKRPERMREYCSNPDLEDRLTEIWQQDSPDKATWSLLLPLSNVWLGVSAENQPAADERIPLLLQTPAAVRFVSAEPLIGPVDFDSPVLQADSDGYLDWAIVGGESGPRARPCDVAWIRSIVQQCQAAGVPAFVKQLGTRSVLIRTADLAFVPDFEYNFADHKGGDPSEWPEDLRVREFPQEASR